MYQTRKFLAGLSLVFIPFWEPAQAEDAPPTPFVDQGACPFECCTYRGWTTTAPVDLFDKPNGRKTSQIPARTAVLGLTGEVISHPVRLRAHRDYEETSIKKGDVFWAIHYEGEGLWAVWHHGKRQSAQFFGDEINDPKVSPGNEISKDHSVWWVKIKTKDGRTGWAISEGNFDNQDACG
jgi:hypothetical protein